MLTASNGKKLKRNGKSWPGTLLLPAGEGKDEGGQRIDEPLDIGKLAAWIFVHEDKGLRVKR